MQELARLHWSWLRLAPLTFSSLAGIAALGGTAFNLVDDLGIDPRDIGPVEAAADRLSDAPLWLGMLVVVARAAGGLRGGRAGAVRRALVRLPADPRARRRRRTSTLRVKRGLLTRRSLSVAEDRLRGAEIVEPLLLRAGRGAQCRALSTGLTKDAQGGALQPPVPRDEAHRVASAALREDPAADHPGAAAPPPAGGPGPAADPGAGPGRGRGGRRVRARLAGPRAGLARAGQPGAAADRRRWSAWTATATSATS